MEPDAASGKRLVREENVLRGMTHGHCPLLTALIPEASDGGDGAAAAYMPPANDNTR